MTNPNAKGKTRTQIAASAREREARALDLRALGHPLDRIASELGYAHASSASKAIQRALDRIPLEAAKRLRETELHALDLAQRSLADKIVRGHLGAIDSMLRIMHHRARLLGLYEPQTDSGIAEVTAVLAAWLGKVRNEDEALDGDLPDQDPQTLQGPPDGENSPQASEGGV
ncbi:helix-turn-helix domain-containing protein [Microbacterium memoriense]|uniref:Helix-turn-helix domain-containing protein n=1 Tax=Microbacterium memoriense TaxID=2978350 RepID=A0ABT2P7V9_9MICO|nr:helix-turn-helix domain-containing protein [Microbacterium memoriense]MCT9000791.1 helix-turn-helix domain-containing protein [Microbacterium memoriense]